MLDTRFLAGAGAGLLAIAAADASALTLFDGVAGTSPQSQGWLSYYTLPGAGVQTVAVGKTTYDSTASAGERGGYSSHSIFGALVNPSFPTLDRADGYSIVLDLKLLSEAHADNSRAGLSVIAVSSDLKGIELGFWNNEIWAQSGPDFVHAESSGAFDTSGKLTYELHISAAKYTLLANNAEVLSGSLRDYSSFGLPYNVPNYLFIGDDTTSASGAFELSRVEMTVPEPSTMLACIVSGSCLLARRQRRA